MPTRTASQSVRSGPVIRRYPFVRWPVLKPRIVWLQGQHWLTVGGTGSGKTTVEGELLPRRKLVVVCVSKGTDATLSGPYFKDYEIIRSWPKGGPVRHERVMLWPPNKGTLRETRAAKAPVFREMFDDILLHIGHWCIAIDETHYMSETLGLEPEITDLEEQGRSHGITIYNNTQRPSGIPLSVYVNSLHGAFFQTQEEYDVRRLGRMRNKYTNTQEMMANIEHLDEHEFVYLDRTNKIPPCRTIVEKRKAA